MKYDDFTESLLHLLRSAKAYYSAPQYDRELSARFWAAADAVQAARFAELRALLPKKEAGDRHHHGSAVKPEANEAIR